MSIAKVIEIIAESDQGWEDAAQNAVKHASKSVRGIRHLYVKEMTAVVRDNKVITYRLNANVTFVVDGDE